MRKAARKQPWWLESGRDRCAICGHAYVYETGYRCVACDGELCSFCVEETVSVNVLCVACKSPEEAET